jgi:hypothetical protein
MPKRQLSIGEILLLHIHPMEWRTYVLVRSFPSPVGEGWPKAGERLLFDLTPCPLSHRERGRSQI